MTVKSVFNFNFHALTLFPVPLIIIYLFYQETQIKKNIFENFKQKVKKNTDIKNFIEQSIPSNIFICSIAKESSIIIDQKSDPEQQEIDFNINYANQKCLNNFKSYDFAELKNNLQDLKCEQDPQKNIFNEIRSYFFKVPSNIPEDSYRNKIQAENENYKSYIDEDNQGKKENASKLISILNQKITSSFSNLNNYIKENQANPTQVTANEKQSCQKSLPQLQNKQYIQSCKIESKFTFVFDNQYYTAQFSRFVWENNSSVLVILTNISEQKRNLYLEQINLYKDKLLAVVSHDLKTPLNCILSVVDYLISINQSQTFDENLKLIQNNTQMLLYMINDILDYSKCKNSQLRLNISSFWLSQLIQEVIKLFSIQIKSQNIQLLENVTSNCDILVYNDRNRLKQVLINLISNALKFTREGSIQIRTQQLEDGNVNISVADTGIGMTDTVKSQLFKDYQTFDNQYHTNTEGVGLGLVICKKLIGLIGKSNEIHVESVLGQGSCFSFTLQTNFSEQTQNECDLVDYSVHINDPLSYEQRLSAYQQQSRNKSKFSQVESNDQNLENASTDTQIASEQSQVQKKNQHESFKILGRTIKTFSILSFKHSHKEFKYEEQTQKTLPNLFNYDFENQLMSNNQDVNEDSQSVKYNRKMQFISENSIQQNQQEDQTYSSNRFYNPISNTPSSVIIANKNPHNNNKNYSLQNLKYTFSNIQQIQETDEILNTSKEGGQKIYNIMIVDDSQYNIIAIKLHLRQFKNFHIEEYLYSEAALKRIKSNEINFDIIFCDMNMPFMDGSQFIKEVRDLKDKIHQPKVIIISADSQINEKKDFQNLNISHFLTKPIIDQNKFCNKVQKLLNE